MRVAIAYNDDAHLKAHLNATEMIGELEVVATAREIADTLGGEHTCDLVAVAGSLEDAARALKVLAPDVIINLCEGALGQTRFESNISLLFDMLGWPHTGCDAIASRICQDKALLKSLLVDAAIPTPEGFATPPEMSDDQFMKRYEAVIGSWPAIVKPSREDAGLGIETGSVVASGSEALSRVRAVEARFREPALVERFVAGGELNQSVYWGRNGAVLLPPGEVVFGHELPPQERIVGWAAKWDEGSAADLATGNRTPADIPSEEREQLQAICLRAASLLGLSAYCRFDIRKDEAGCMFVIDVNPNPDIGVGTGFRKALSAAGIGFRDFLNELMIAAVSSASGPISRTPLPVG